MEGVGGQSATGSSNFAVRKAIQTLCGVAIFAALMFSWLWTLTFINRITILRHKDHYKPAIFVVTGAEYHRADEGGDSWWLKGDVNGREERLVPRLKLAPHNAEGFFSQIPRGTRIEVIYDPDATGTLVQGESLRVIEASSDFWQREERLRNRLAAVVLLPGPLALGLYLTVRYLNGRAARVAASGFPD